MTVNLKFGDKPKVDKVARMLEGHVFEDFPPEVFLQRLDMIESLLHVYTTSEDIESVSLSILSFLNSA